MLDKSLQKREDELFQVGSLKESDARPTIAPMRAAVIPRESATEEATSNRGR